MDKGLGHSDIDVDKIQDLISKYESKKEEWKNFALWYSFIDSSLMLFYRDTSKAYTRNLLDKGNGQYYNIMILCIVLILKNSFRIRLESREIQSYS